VSCAWSFTWIFSMTCAALGIVFWECTQDQSA
jgi:hypothetical protein